MPLFFVVATPPTAVYTLSLHDALPICASVSIRRATSTIVVAGRISRNTVPCAARSEEHTSELQSLTNLVCRLRLEKKKRDEQKARPRSSLSTLDRVL